VADPQNYGTYSLDSATVISMPLVRGQMDVDFFGSPPPGSTTSRRLGNGNGGGGVKRKRLSDNFQTSNKKKKTVAAAPAPAPAHNSVCVMDVGQGNCNLAIDNNNEPRFYFDVGFPLYFYTATAPTNLFGGAAPPSGPILQNAAGNLEVILSHWDWDHWRLAAIWPVLAALPWTVPVQPIGGASLNFFNNNLPNCQVLPVGGPTTLNYGNFTAYRAFPPAGAHPAMVVNNTGIALGIDTQLPFGAPATHQVVITGDANFSSLPAPFPLAPNISGITAVHHGSNAHGAANNLPVPTAPYAAAARIAYSCGLSPTGYRPYGFPNPLAIPNYQASGWNAPHEMDTPEGPGIRTGVANYGNIRMGSQAALPAAYNVTAFFNYPHALQ
jgi:hypothetical protein